jgi:hypothetical protein
MPQDSFTPALARLDPASRALLDLSLRRDMRPEEIGDLLGTDSESVIVAREAALGQLASELGFDEHRDLDDLRTRLIDLPGEAWTPPVEDTRPRLAVVPDVPAAAAVEPARAERPARPERPEPKRRSRLPLLLALLAVLAVVLVVVLASSGGDDEQTASSAPAPAPQLSSKPAKQPSKPEPAAGERATLDPVGSASGATGSATLLDGGKRLKLEVSGLPSGSYEVWLYDSVIEAQSIGRATGRKIDLDVKLPPTASNYRYIDLSREPSDGNPNHSGESVMRIELSKLSR